MSDSITPGWKAHRLILKLESGLHMGHFKVGNIQRTRLYITGRSIWGALTAGLTRLANSNEYLEIGNKVSKSLAWSYFFPALLHNQEIVTLLPFYAAGGLQYRLVEVTTGQPRGLLEAKKIEQLLLYSTNSTALNYTNKISQDQSLHEVEFVSPKTLSSLTSKEGFTVAKNSSVLFCGYIFSTKVAEADPILSQWKTVFECLQFGGERSYGGGLIKLNGKIEELLVRPEMLGYSLWLDQLRPRIELLAQNPTLAHCPVDSQVFWQGDLEAVIGREVTYNQNKAVSFGTSLNHTFVNAISPICYRPGSSSDQIQSFQIGDMGIWHKV